MIKDFLAIFSRVILSTKGDFISIDFILFIIDILIKYLQKETISYSLPYYYRLRLIIVR
jgi:hypothetical protein